MTRCIDQAPVAIFFYPLSSYYDSMVMTEYFKNKEKLLVILPGTDFAQSLHETIFPKTNIIDVSTLDEDSIDQVAFKIGMRLTQIIGKPRMRWLENDGHKIPLG